MLSVVAIVLLATAAFGARLMEVQTARAIPAEYEHLGRVSRNASVRLLFAVKLSDTASLDREFWARSGSVVAVGCL